MSLPVAKGIVETNSVDYIQTLFAALRDEAVVVPLRSVDDSQRIKNANVGEVVSPKQLGGWCDDVLPPASGSGLAHISFTSGTEGAPKGVFISRSALDNTVARLQDVMNMDDSAREYIGVPVYHSFGYGRCRHIASVGGQFYIPDNGFDPREVSAMLADKTINALSLVPSLLRVFLSSPGLLGDERHNLQWLEIGSQAMSQEEKRETIALFPNAAIVQHYGLTEASRSSLLSFNDSPEALDSVGKAFGDVEFKISEHGCICIRGSHVASQILKDGQLLPAVGVDGWFETSDLGSVEGDYLYFEGRADNMVNCGGQKLSTERLEAAIIQGLGDNAEVVVSRVPDSVYGEGFLVSYLAASEESQIKQVAVDSLLALGISAKNAVSFNVVLSIPKTHTGKVQHKKLADDYLEVQQASLEEGAVSSGSDIEQAFAGCLGLGSADFNASSSVRDIGIDSIQSVQLSIKLESLLGYLPHDWRDQSVQSLSNLPRKKAPIESSVASSASSSQKAKPIWDGSSNMNPAGIGFWGLVKEDFVTHDRDWCSQGLFAIFVHRFGNWRMGIKSKLLRAPMTLLYRFLRKWTQVFCGIKLDYTVHVGRRVKLEHFDGMILGARSIGDDTIIRQNTTFGIRDMSDLAAKPIIESGVNIGAGVVIVGDITIGRYSIIGPNSVITESLPPFSVVSVAPPVVTSLSK